MTAGAGFRGVGVRPNLRTLRVGVRGIRLQTRDELGA